MENDLRHWMRLIENAGVTALMEIERGGELGDDNEWEQVSKADFDARQADLLGDETDYEPQGSFDGYDVATKNPVTFADQAQAVTYVLFRGSTPIAYATLESFGDGDNGYRVKAIRIAPSEQGRNLAPRFYRWLLTDGQIDTLFADENQTDGGAKIWERLVTTPGVAVYITSSVKTKGRRVRTNAGLAKVWDSDRYHLYAMAET